MNAGRDVERLISNWLTEEATDRSRDRVLATVHQTIEHTPQRRFRVAWREPMYVNPLRLAGMAAVFTVAVIGAALVGRATAPGGAGGPPSPGPSSSEAASGSSLEDYRAARNEICLSYSAQMNPLKPQIVGLTEPGTPADDRAVNVQAMTDIITLNEAMTAELSRLVPPTALEADHLVQITDYQHMSALLRQELERVAAADYAGALALDLATNPLSQDIGRFENANHLSHCP
jgi:hypothetical protein